MIDQILHLIKEQTQDTVVKNAAIPDKHNEGVQKEIFNSIQGGITSAVSGGNISGVMDLFNKGTKKQSLAKNPIVKSISKTLVSNLSQKFGLSKKVSSGIANTAIPLILNKVSQLIADPKEKSVDMSSVIGSLTGKSGGFDLGDIAGSLLSGSNTKGSSKGGLLGKLTGLFK